MSMCMPHHVYSGSSSPIQDVNDNSPVFATSLYESSLVENTPPGPLIATVTATDSDIGVNADITYSAPNQNLVTVNGSSGEVTLASPPDHEQGAIVNIQVSEGTV